MPKSPIGESKKEDTKNMSISLTPIFGISIPVIIRVGENDAKVSISDIKLEEGEDSKLLKLNFNRTGTMSVYGDITVRYITPRGKITQLAFAKGVGVYTPNQRRSLQLSLENKSGVDYSKGRIQVLYTTPEEAKSVKMAEGELVLN
jgi:hypothetical protein